MGTTSGTTFKGNVALSSIRPTGPEAANANDPRAKYWREMRDLVVRGVSQPETLTPDEVLRISSVALLGLKRIAMDWGDPPVPPAPNADSS